MKLLISNLLNLTFNFYTHNGPLIFYGFGILLSIAQLWRKGSRNYLLTLLGFIFLVLSFEYQKHFVAHFHSHLVLQVADPDTQALEYGLANRFFKQVLPIGLDSLGWLLLYLGLFINRHRS